MRIARTRSPGHPDKACDLIADMIVDEYLRRDPASRLRVHVTGGKGALFVTGMTSSKADFDVGATAARAAAALGARNPIEPFVAIEPVSGAALDAAMRHAGPVLVSGYATRETPEGIPSTTLLSRRIAKRLEDLRTTDADWFWLEPGFDVTVVESAPGDIIVSIVCGHGVKELAEVRSLMTAALTSLVEASRLRINLTGPKDVMSLDHDIGSSGTVDEPYGSALPIAASPIGIDPFNPRTFGMWLTRGLARQVLERSGSQAVLVQAVYESGQDEPVHLKIRDERGKSLFQPSDRERLHATELSRFFRHGLKEAATRWGFVGEAGLPWE